MKAIAPHVAPPAASGGTPDRLFAQVYQRLKALASRHLSANRSATLNTTALIHEL
ncbi:MAG: hypothetical protein LBE59_10195 [Nevskiaceae bacterium]|nr:hypothetical protein [Nevskiaceae bacterium]